LADILEVRGVILTISAKARWRSSERIVEKLLDELGYRVLDAHYRIIIDGLEVGEIDFVVEDPSTGERYGVEVKSGRVSIAGVRQAYVNCMLAGLKPIIVCKGVADDNARILAEKLGVKIIQLSDWFLVESEELEVLMREVMESLLEQYFTYLLTPMPRLRADLEKFLRAIAESQSPTEAATKLGLRPDELSKRIGELKSLGLIPSWARKYSTIRRIAELNLLKTKILDELNKLLESMNVLKEELNLLRRRLDVIERTVNVIEETIKMKELKELAQRMGVEEAGRGSQ